MIQELSVVGKRLTQPDGVAKATGAAKYTVDIKLPGMLIGKVLRSPYPHAKIIKIDKSKAEKLSGVEAVITLEDTPKIPFASSFRDLPMAPSGALQRPDLFVLADKARYVGDGIAAVAAINESIADEALELIDVEYEKLPALFDPEEAMKPGAPKVHDYAERNIAVHVGYPLAKGDVERGFAQADCVVEDTFFTSKQIHCQLEPEACVASVDATGRVTVWSPCQLAHPARREMAHAFGIPAGKIRWISPFVGGSFGSRLSTSAEPMCIALAMKTGKPVKLEYTREENFSVMETRTSHKYSIKMGFKKDGTLIAMQIKVITSAGGYLGRAQLCGGITLIWGMGHYRCPNTAGEADVVYVNTNAGGAMQGFGNPAIMWGVEQVVDMAAEKLGVDPLELRLKNIKKVGEISNMGLPTESTYLDECIKVGAERIGWREKRGRKKEGVMRRGIGMATMTHCSGAHPLLLEHTNAFIKLNEDGSANLIVHPGSPGTHIWGTLSQIAAEELGIRAEDIHIVTGDTDITMFDLGSHASRSTYVTGNAVLMAARQAKGQLLERAAKTLEVSPDELEVKDRRVYVKASPEKSISVADVCFNAIYNFKGECLNISGKCSWESRWNSTPTAAYFTEVEVNTETGEVKVIKFITAMDCGKAINPMTVEGQLQGGILQGIGYGLTEDYVINKDTGVLESDNFTTYKIPGSLDLPDTEVIIIDKPDPRGPFGAKGVAEPCCVGVAPAIANAIYDAIGVRVKDMPVTPEKILVALKAKSA